jgi:DNA-directed RNA polymerase alpha subunit
MLFSGLALVLGAAALVIHKNEDNEEVISSDDLQDDNGSDNSVTATTSNDDSVTGFDSDTSSVASQSSTEHDDKLEVLLTSFTGISKSYTNALASENIHTAKQFLSKSDEELHEIKGIGEKSIALIHEKIEEI